MDKPICPQCGSRLEKDVSAPELGEFCPGCVWEDAVLDDDDWLDGELCDFVDWEDEDDARTCPSCEGKLRPHPKWGRYCPRCDDDCEEQRCPRCRTRLTKHPLLGRLCILILSVDPPV